MRDGHGRWTRHATQQQRALACYSPCPGILAARQATQSNKWGPSSDMSPPLLLKGPLHVQCGPSKLLERGGVGRLREQHSQSPGPFSLGSPWHTAPPQLRKRRPSGLRLGLVCYRWPHEQERFLFVVSLAYSIRTSPTGGLSGSLGKVAFFSVCLTWAIRGYDGGTVGEGVDGGGEARLQKGIFVPSSFRYG